MKTSSSCELTPRVPSPPPCQLPPGPWTSLASSALCLDCLHANPSTTSVDQSAEACPYPTTVRLSGCRWHPTSSKDAAKRRVKSGNFNWFYRQLYYALNTIAAISYISDFETNKKDLQEVKENVSKQGGLLSIDTIWEAIQFFAYQKVPKKHMTILIGTLNYIYTVTKVDTEPLLILLSNMNHLSHSEAKLDTNIAILKTYILKGKSTPSKLVNILNDALPIAIENDIDFALFTDTILTYLSYGYTQERIVEKLSAKFTNQAG